jgi:hypothetical protein
MGCRGGGIEQGCWGRVRDSGKERGEWVGIERGWGGRGCQVVEKCADRGHVRSHERWGREGSPVRVGSSSSHLRIWITFSRNLDPNNLKDAKQCRNLHRLFYSTGCLKCKRMNDIPITPKILVRINFQRYPLKEHYVMFFVSNFQRSGSNSSEMATS